MSINILSNLVSGAYYVLFQIAGIILATFIFKKNRTTQKLLLGSSLGSLIFAWLPILFSFVLSFGVASHIFALFSLVPVFYFAFRRKVWERLSLSELKISIFTHKWAVVLFTLLFILWCVLLHSHIILPGDDGAIYTGQCTYGDMNMHLGFITSIARGGEFPPEYSIFPGTRLAYPFLSASVSSSLYVLGATLRFAYIFPMLFAFAQIMGYTYLISYRLLQSTKKALFSSGLFLLNGGFGFVYFLPFREDSYTLQELFNGFYITPTNLIGENIRWVNVIADMFLPQRATLFGYATLFAFLFLLLRAYETQESKYFVLYGIFAGGLPLIHTHSFLAAGLCSAAFLFHQLWKNTGPVSIHRYIRPFGIFVISMVVLCFIQRDWQGETLIPEHLMTICLCFVGLFILVGALLLFLYIRRYSFKQLGYTWSSFLVLTMLLALPQLLCFTFGQVSEGGFVRGHFGWGNQSDFHPWFYLMNIGMPLLLFLGSLLRKEIKHGQILLFMFVTWIVAELVVFTPNTYDNNKLLYVVYLFMCVYAADFALDLIRRIGPHFARIIAGILLCLLCFISGILTLGREVVSRYQLYGTDMCALAAYVADNTPTNAVILTDTRHNNEIASLTGKTIVCGADTFLYYHGIHTAERQDEVRAMYEMPASSMELFKKYNVTHVVISGYERSNYAVDENYFLANCSLVFSHGSTLLFEIPTKGK